MTNSEVATLLRELAQEIEAGGRVEASAGCGLSGLITYIRSSLKYKKPGKRDLEIQVTLKETP